MKIKKASHIFSPSLHSKNSRNSRSVTLLILRLLLYTGPPIQLGPYQSVVGFGASTAAVSDIHTSPLSTVCLSPS